MISAVLPATLSSANGGGAGGVVAAEEMRPMDRASQLGLGRGARSALFTAGSFLLVVNAMLGALVQRPGQTKSNSNQIN